MLRKITVICHKPRRYRGQILRKIIRKIRMVHIAQSIYIFIQNIIFNKKFGFGKFSLARKINGSRGNVQWNNGAIRNPRNRYRV